MPDLIDRWIRVTSGWEHFFENQVWTAYLPVILGLLLNSVGFLALYHESSRADYGPSLSYSRGLVVLGDEIFAIDEYSSVRAFDFDGRELRAWSVEDCMAGGDASLFATDQMTLFLSCVRTSSAVEYTKTGERLPRTGAYVHPGESSDQWKAIGPNGIKFRLVHNQISRRSLSGDWEIVVPRNPWLSRSGPASSIWALFAGTAIVLTFSFGHNYGRGRFSLPLVSVVLLVGGILLILRHPRIAPGLLSPLT